MKQNWKYTSFRNLARPWLVHVWFVAPCLFCSLD